MNRLIIGLGTIACLGFFTAAQAANGSVAGNMPRDYWNASAKRLQPKVAIAGLTPTTTPTPPRAQETDGNPGRGAALPPQRRR